MKNNLIQERSKKKLGRIYRQAAVFIMAAFLLATTASAANNPITTINNFTDFIFQAIQAIGVIILGWGVVQVGMSLQSHDPSQRSNGMLCFFGGLLIAMAKPIIDLILA